MKKIMIFGRPGSGKSKFAYKLSKHLELPIYHLGKYFFVSGWAERNPDDFRGILNTMVNKGAWIIDGNSTRSLETRWQAADLVVYFNYNRFLCLFRLFKRRFGWSTKTSVHDRAPNCPKILRLRLVKYMWTFDRRVSQSIADLTSKYPDVTFVEIRSDKDLQALETILKKRRLNSENGYGIV
jgi:adenylate kinase family enzyme